MEALSPTMEEGRLVKWVKKEGDTVAKGEVLAEVETDKAVMELVARGDGVLRKRVLDEGQTAPVGQLVGVIGTADEDIGAILASAPAAASAASAGGSTSAAPAPTAAAQTPASAIPATPTPVPQTPAAQAPAAQAPAASPSPASQTPASAPSPLQHENGERPRSSPLARRLASDRGLDLGQVHGSGPGGRIIKRDIEAAIASGPAASTSAARPRAAAVGDYTDVPLTQIRKTIARRLTESIGPIPTFYLTMEADLTRTAELREAMLDAGTAFKVSFNDIILKAVATALAGHPEVNAHWLGDRVRQFNRVHLGVAVAIPDGLITPVVFDADRKGLGELSYEVRELAQKARDRKLTPEQYTGSTFSVSNLGMFGIDQFTAIINPPEAGIIAVGAVEDKAVAVDGQVVVRKRARFTMSCDHRVIDGATGARFLQDVRRMLENPLMIVY